ncbi:hypothetical protein [Noviherbaspirillum pedocola]|uniref:Uncharacterized protein n=1 Tax=Noviherbaspirillum pedocola TaxID=2801341 RepID=A0A934W9L6_9BURK|nr:hypothetical protein [Noviherbaspirillum pedocola]MBK4739090.1 hypothetical protein [Noviherbaspirillum pedocola]
MAFFSPATTSPIYGVRIRGAHIRIEISPQRKVAVERAIDRLLLGGFYNCEDKRVVQFKARRRLVDWIRRCAALDLNWKAHYSPLKTMASATMSTNLRHMPMPT